MKKIEYTDEDLLRYLDGKLSSEQTLLLEQALEVSAPLKARLEEFRLIHSLLQAQPKLQSPSRQFTQRVMAGLDSAPSPSFFSHRNGLFLLIGVMIASGLVITLLSLGVFDTQTPLTVKPLTLKKEWFTLPSFTIALQGKILINSILILNLGLAFVLLDRTILRPLFQRRASAW